MSFFTRMMSYLTLGSPRRFGALPRTTRFSRSSAWWCSSFFPGLDGLLTGDRLSHLAKAPAALLRDSISAAQSQAPPADLISRATFG
jgi:hypothetical protein